MPKTKIQSLSLALLVFLCLQAQVQSSFDLHSLRSNMTNLQATTWGDIEFKQDSYGVYVEADLIYNPSFSSNRSDFTNLLTNMTEAAGTAKMMLSLVNSESMVATDCSYFSYYDCSEYSDCKEYDTKKSFDFPWFSANTKIAQGEIYLDYIYWVLSPADLYIAYSCINDGTVIGSERYGVIGLGTGGNPGSDFYEKLFSIYIASDLSKGKLLFKNAAANYAKSTEAVYTLYANSTWQVPTNSGHIKVRDSAIDFHGNIMFDINTDVALGIPYFTYIYVLSYLNEVSGLNCDGTNYYRPICTYNGKIKDLPDVIINFNKNLLKVPSDLYASVISEGSSFYLNFKATHPSLTGKSFVTDSFSNSLILGTRFMSYYFPVFDATSGFNMIYLYPSGSLPPEPNNWWIFAVIAGAILIIMVVVGCYIKKKRDLSAENNNTISVAADNNTTNVVYNTVYQAPLIENQQRNDPDAYNAQQSQGIQGIYPTFNNNYQSN